MQRKTPKNLLGKYNKLMREEKAEGEHIAGGEDYNNGHGKADGSQKKDAYMPVSNQALFGVSRIPTKKGSESENSYHPPMKSKTSSGNKISGSQHLRGVTSKKTPTTKGEGPTYNPRAHIGKPTGGRNYKGKSWC